MSGSGMSKQDSGGVADAGAGGVAAASAAASAVAESKLRQRTVADSRDQNCSQFHNGALVSEENSSSKQCSLHLWSRKALLRRKDLPKHLQFNPYIETGYRPLLSAWGCLMSLFYFHNETINIITHGVPMLYILLWWPTLLPWSDITVPVLPWIHLVSTVSPWVGSTIYHLFMNHRAGESCYKSLLHLDMFGIWITQSFGALTTVYASVSCLSSPWIWRVLAIYCAVSLWCLYKALSARSAMARRLSFSLAVVTQLSLLCFRGTPLGGGHPHAAMHYFMQASHARNPWERRFCFTLPFLMRAVSATLRVTAWGGGNPRAFKHIILQDLLAVLGGFVGALRVPEKWVPGRLDLLANSHHIMHVVVVYAVYHLHQGAVLDLVWLSGNSTCPHSTVASPTPTL